MACDGRVTGTVGREGRSIGTMARDGRGTGTVGREGRSIGTVAREGRVTGIVGREGKAQVPVCVRKEHQVKALSHSCPAPPCPQADEI